MEAQEKHSTDNKKEKKTGDLRRDGDTHATHDGRLSSTYFLRFVFAQQR
jgi:hypothetical protein